MEDTNNQILPFRSFILEQIRFVVFQLQYNGKEDSLTLSFDEFLSTLGDAESMGFNVKWLKSHVIVLKDLKKVGPFVYASLSPLQQLRAKRTSCINKAKETKVGHRGAQHFIHPILGIHSQASRGFVIQAGSQFCLLDSTRRCCSKTKFFGQGN